MRIVGGELRGRPLLGPRNAEIRPTSDRLRETMFDILIHRFDDPVTDARVLDLFAGTGALGLEALSRGAREVLFIDTAPAARALIRDNAEELGVAARTRLFRRDATRLGQAGTLAPFSLVFADPPYGTGQGHLAVAAAASGGWLQPEALAVVEEAGSLAIREPDGFTVLDRRQVGRSQIVILRFGRES